MEKNGEKFFSVENVTKLFGGLKAVDGVSLEIKKGQILGLIGPNGAGKTTLFNCITGIYTVDSGKVLFQGEDLTGQAPHIIKRKGISRTFQSSRLIPKLSVLDNVLIGSLENQTTSLFENIFRRGKFKGELEEAIEKVSWYFEMFNEELIDRMFTSVGDVPQIDRRRLEIIRALMSNPDMLLLDEPSAGMTPEESVELMNDIVSVQDRYPDLAIIIVEHDMVVIEGITEKVTALNYGRKITEGTFHEVSENEELKKAYLGT